MTKPPVIPSWSRISHCIAWAFTLAAKIPNFQLPLLFWTISCSSGFFFFSILPSSASFCAPTLFRSSLSRQLLFCITALRRLAFQLIPADLI
ncbi:hypothetical protein CI102_7155 [Trichoderma harzianum]|nr:hypothetical protein CI102_7155 [Trichoderma harzianum]